MIELFTANTPNGKKISIMLEEIGFKYKLTKININKNVFNSLNFHFFSNNDKPFNEKKLNIKIWYDAKTLLWIKASYEKFGTWEYKISEVKY